MSSDIEVKEYNIISLLKKLINLVYLLKNKFDLWVEKKERKITLKRLMENAKSYQEWKKYAIELDSINGKDIWKKKKETKLYDWKEVEKLIMTLQKKREMKDIIGIVHYIRVNLMKNIYSTSNPTLYQVCSYGTKQLLESFHDEMLKSLDMISNFNEKVFPLYKKIEFFSETRHSYGRTALLLSGGASLGMFHTGVIKALYESNLLPRIICGSSAGSIVASLVCTEAYENIPILIERELKLGPFEYKHKKFSFLRKLFRFITRGVLFDVEVLKEFLRENIGDLTFQEAFDKTGWILNITVTGYKEHDNHRLLNYLTAPNVLIWSAACASSCVPLIFDPVELLCKNEYGHIIPYNSNKARFIDGSIMHDLPMQRLSELFNVNIFIVSQTNPYVIPFLEQDDNKEIFVQEKKFNFWKLLKNLLFSEIKHRAMQLNTLGILPHIASRFLNMITQDYRGHVTLFPVPRLIDYLKVLHNPSKETIAYCVEHSSQRTYPKIPYIDNILKFEFALDKHYKNLKSRLNKFNVSSDKRYQIDDEEDFDDFKPLIIEEHKNNINDLIYLKTDNLSNTSNTNKNCPYTSSDEDIVNKYNKIVFYNEENYIKNDEFKKECLSDITDFSNISPLLTYDQSKKNKIIKGYNKDKNKMLLHRIDSFSLPRTQSKQQMYKNK